MEKIVNMNDNNAAKGKTVRKKKGIYMFVATVGVLVLFFSIKYISYAVTHEGTDNAQIDGNIIPLRTKVGGYVSEIRFVENQRVSKGDTLIVFETTDLEAQVDQAEARLENAIVIVQTGHTGVESATFNTEAADENISGAKAKMMQAEGDYLRVEKMYLRGAATSQAFEAAKTVLDMARSQYNAVSAQRETAGSQVSMQRLQIKAAEAKVKEAGAQLATAKYMLANAYVIAPCNGIISKKTVEEGQLTIAGAALAAIIDLDHLWITANFKETQLDKVKPGQDAKASVDAYPEVDLAGSVESMAGATGPKFSLLPADNATGNFVKVTQRIPVRIAITSIKNDRQKQLVPGMNVIVDVKIK